MLSKYAIKHPATIYPHYHNIWGPIYKISQDKHRKYLGLTYAKLNIILIRKMQFLKSTFTFVHKIVCIYIGRISTS